MIIKNSPELSAIHRAIEFAISLDNPEFVDLVSSYRNRPKEATQMVLNNFKSEAYLIRIQYWEPKKTLSSKLEHAGINAELCFFRNYTGKSISGILYIGSVLKPEKISALLKLHFGHDHAWSITINARVQFVRLDASRITILDFPDDRFCRISTNIVG